MRSTPLILPLLAVSCPTVAAQQFQNQPGIFPGGSAWTEGVECADVDQDGDLDVFFADGEGFSGPGQQRQNTLMINRVVQTGSLAFLNESVARLGTHLSHAKGVTTGDIDGDGWVDALFANAFNSDTPFLYINRGAGQPGFFDEESGTRGLTEALSSAGAQFGDLDDDGDLDLVICDSGNSFLGGTGGKPRYYRNDGNGNFTEDAAALGAPTKRAHMDIQLVDIDNDWDLDVFGSNRANNGGGDHYLLLNDGTGTFSDASNSIPGTSSSVYEAEVGDLDGDNDLDFFFVSLTGFQEGPIENRLNPTGTLSFQVGTPETGFVDDNEIVLLDVDMDSDLDALVGSLGSTERIYRNDGGLNFTPINSTIQGISDSTLDMTAADLDNDGAYDLITAQGESNPGQWSNKVYVNSGVADTIAPQITALDAPLLIGPGGTATIKAKLRDQLVDDQQRYLAATIHWASRTAPVTPAISHGASTFTPNSTLIQAGDSVIVTNNSGAVLTLTSSTPNYPVDLQLQPGSSYEMAFVRPGNYTIDAAPSGASLQVQVGGTSMSAEGLKLGGGIWRFDAIESVGTGVDRLCYEIHASDWPGNVSVLRNQCIGVSTCSVTVYCTAKVNSLGCTPSISSTGTPSATSASPFTIQASNVLNNKNGILFYGFASNASPFQGGLLCAQPPLRRTPPSNSGGNPPPNDCSGVQSFDMNAWIQSGVDANLTTGVTVYSQFWTRDNGSPSQTGLSDGLSFIICP